MAEHLIALAELFPWQIEQGRHRGLRQAAEPMAPAMGNHHHIARPQLDGFGAVQRQPAMAGGDDVEHQRAVHRRQLQPPGLAELGEAIEGALHPQPVQGLRQGIHRAERLGQGRCRRRSQRWSDGHGLSARVRTARI